MMSAHFTMDGLARLTNQPPDIQAILSFDSFFKSGELLEKSCNLSTEARKAGNELFNQMNHNETIHSQVLFHYTKCIAHGPKKSEELAMGYGNRSALLLHLERYQECLMDIDKALAITKSAKLKSKLQERKELCLELLNQTSLGESAKDLNLNRNKDQNDTLSKWLTPAVPSDVLPGASESIALHYNETFGRHMIATRDIAPGEVIIKEKGFVCYPNKEHMYLVCSHCLVFAWNAIPCDRCVCSVYCSEACKKEAWKEYHNEECSTLSLFYIFTSKSNIPDVMAASRLLIKTIKKEGLAKILKEAEISDERKGNDMQGLLSNGILDNEKFKTYCNLMYNEKRISNNPEDMKDQAHHEHLTMYLLLRHTNLIRPKDGNLDIDQRDVTILIKLKNLFARLRNIFNTNAIMYKGTLCNCPTLVDCGLNCPMKRGIIIGPCSSLVNHSCNPNADKLCIPNGKIVLFATAPIKKGDQVCVSYGPLFTTEKARRQKLLKDCFFFSCKCIACKENWPTYNDMDFCCRDPKTDDVIKLRTFSQFKKEFFNEETSSFFNKIVEKLEFDEETLRYAIKFSEWAYKHYDNGMAFMMSITYSAYICTAFYKLFGEKCIMPAKCRQS